MMTTDGYSTVGAVAGSELDKIAVMDGISNGDLLVLCKLLVNSPRARVGSIRRHTSWSNDKINAAIAQLIAQHVLLSSVRGDNKSYPVDYTNLGKFIDAFNGVDFSGYVPEVSVVSADGGSHQPPEHVPEEPCAEDIIAQTLMSEDAPVVEPCVSADISVETPSGKVQYAFRGRGIKPKHGRRTLDSLLADIAAMPKTCAITGEERDRKIDETYAKLTQVIGKLNDGIKRLSLSCSDVGFDDERVVIVKSHRKNGSDGVIIYRKATGSILMQFPWNKEFTQSWLDEITHRAEAGAEKLLLSLVKRAERR